ncbi:MAG: alanine--tRNA ligase [Candidatus Nanoarchaeia archaeon]|nr:alanine--tRNA ligase [Candidatus Nanoarchaeia archaeon]
MNRKELIEKYMHFFKSKGHKIIPNASLIPKDDPTVLFTTAGMHPLVPYLLGQPHPLGKRLCNVQRCIRTTDIDEVGDAVHHTFFEMLGNWSLGDYWKEDAIKLTFEFHNKVLKIPLEKYAVSCFAGDEDSLRDEESAKVWHSLGVPKERIAFLPKEENWWGPAGLTGPCGPNTEMFVWTGKSPAPKKFNEEDKDWVEIGNDVLLQYNKNTHGKYERLQQKNIDFGGGIERNLAILNGLSDNYETEVWKPIIKEIERLSGKKYKGNEKTMRIIADHVKASVFIIADGATPSNSEQGYVLRRLIRRAVKYGRELKIKNFIKQVAEPVFRIYEDYPELKINKQKVLEELEKEENKFLETIERGIRIFENIIQGKKSLSGKDAFLLYQSYGFPIELTEEECRARKIKFNRNDFELALKTHQELSRTASAGQFKSGLADNSEATTRLHTAAHLLLASLRHVLNDRNINQKGSNITPERLRMDFSFPRKLTDDEIKKVESLVNEKIKEAIPVKREELSLEQARKSGALGIFEEKYKGIVSVYTINNFSKEICTGPHVKNTKDIGHFKITKEESSGSGVRRIKAIVE